MQAYIVGHQGKSQNISFLFCLSLSQDNFSVKIL